MEITDFKTLINEVRCGRTSSQGFTDEDFDNVKACIEEVQPIDVDIVSPNIQIDTSQMDCMASGIDKIQEIVEEQKRTLVIGMHQGILRQKVQELRDNLSIVKLYYDTRYDLLRELTDILNTQGKNKAYDRIENIESLPDNPEIAQLIIQESISKISNQLIVNFWGIGSPFPARTTSFDFRLINKNRVTVKLINPESNNLDDTDILIKDSPHLTNRIFEGIDQFQIIDQEAYDPNSGSNPPIDQSDYDSIPGLLYNGIGGSYQGLYRRLGKPLKYLFTLEERGLSLNQEEVDPVLKKIQDAPTSMPEGDATYYISDQSIYEEFYATLEEEYKIRVEKERNEVYPNAIRGANEEIKRIAQREVADLVRFRIEIGFNDVTEYYRTGKEYVDSLIAKVDEELHSLNQKIKNNVQGEDQLTKKVSAIACFTKAANAIQETDPDCEEATREKLGTDPLYLRTLGEVNFGLPDIGSQCYWKEFANSLNKVSLLPFPDLSGPPPANILFRYWPINCVLPAGPALALITVPPVWKPLFVVPTAVGTLVCFLSMPIAPIGIPLPSIYLFYFAPDGSKYLVLATNLPSLWSNPKNLLFGFELDNSSTSQNPLGLSPTNPYKGYPIKGSFTQPLAISAASSRATRLTKLAADIAMGKAPTVTNINGEQLPFDMTSDEYSKYYISESEIMKNILDANPSDEILREIDTLKGTLNRQLDKLGDMQTEKINGLRERLRNEKKAALSEAQNEKALDKKRKAKKAARAINTITLQEKITSTVSAFNEHIDNIKFGTIRFPKDATKNNPGVPEALTAIVDLITMASLGDMKIEESALSLNSKVKQAVGKINMSAVSTQQEFDVSTEDGLREIKQSLGNMVNETIKYLKGDAVSVDVSGANSEEEERLIAEANRKTQELARDALAFTAVALLNPPEITIFDFSKKCCEISSDPVFSGVPPDLAIAFASLSALMRAMIDGLDADSIVNFLGVSTTQIPSSFLIGLFDSLTAIIPNVSLPSPANLLILIQAFLVPILTLISIPKALNPLQPPMLSIVIPLDPILKPLPKSLIAGMIAALFELMDQASTYYEENPPNIGRGEVPTIDSSNTNGVFAESAADKETAKQVFSAPCGMGSTVSIIVNPDGVPVGKELTFTMADGETSSTTDPVFDVRLTLDDGTVISLLTMPLLALDLTGYFHLITGNDIIEFVRTLMNSVYDMVMAPLKAVVQALSALALSLNSYSFNIVEAALPLLTILKLAKIAIDAAIPHSAKVQIISGEVFNLIQASVIPALEAIEPVLREVAWIGATALCALASPASTWTPVIGARLLHPIMNADDLPPWERLTHKNPLFAIFLDEIAWRGSMYATGSLIFQSKTPAVLPYTPTFPIVHITPHLT